MLFHRLLFTFAVLLFSVNALADEALTPDELKFFETKIRPVLIRECYGCHSNQSGNVRGGLRLDTKELTAIGGSSGPAIVPGDLEESWLYNAIIHEDFVMPPKRKLPQNVIDDFKQWIEMGAPDPRVNQVVEIQATISDDDIQSAQESFWAYQPPVKPTPPTVENASWPRTDIDRFVLARLEESSLEPAGDADSLMVLRRLCFDLTGLPPSPEQIEYFSSKWKLNPEAAIAFVVDRLLEKEQFGERWGRHWLDVVRFAESTGREVNVTFPHAWRYRDYVIDAFNNDKPFNELVQEQIAGDLLPAPTDEEWTEHLIATTFLAMGPKNVNEQNRVQFQADLVDEQIDVTTRVFLGMSVACARCHDHKFDAIPQVDYYALAGVFSNTETYFGNPPSEYGSFATAQAKRTSSLIRLPIEDPNPFDKKYSASELSSLKEQIEGKMRELVETRRNVTSGQNAGGDAGNALRQRLRIQNELNELSAKLSVVDDQGRPRSYCMGVQERGSPTNARLLVRGEIDQPAQTVTRGFPQVLCSTPVSISPKKGGRLELARWIGSDENPLTARVMVNRVWQYMIGQGLVTSTENFGVTGQPPSHPELLDYLASRFVESGWSVKSLVRDIATSRSYRMKSTFNVDYHEFDPDNALLWRANPRRLDAEAIRDAMLAVSGQLDLERPRASVVAEAGYTRVRDGALGNPREIAQRTLESMRQAGPAMGGSRTGGGNSGGGMDSGNPRRRSFGQNQAGGLSQRGRRGNSRQANAVTLRELLSKSQNQLDMEDANFRSVYLPIVRDEVPRSLDVFDFADASTVSGTRESSQTANQSLYMMNNPFVIRVSDAFADRVVGEHKRLPDQVAYAFELAYGRSPTSSERQASFRFLKSVGGGREPSANSKTFSAFCQSLFASAEFRFVD
ncbi:PSD1 and planctomycete cytochrome C domain-containing protein [Neorhodopirellula lusitana]|uniref:PSD1 and planctomycete cytochrome C domain-containing protein n=1 Tax=Neorhodopirellula lusitana TaxID=445327 RepID=UPI00384C0652